jgi:uncharacterized protein (DUF1919 family)
MEQEQVIALWEWSRVFKPMGYIGNEMNQFVQDSEQDCGWDKTNDRMQGENKFTAMKNEDDETVSKDIERPEFQGIVLCIQQLLGGA